MRKLVVDILRKKQAENGWNMVPIGDIKQEILERTEMAIEELSKAGTVYKPRHNMLKLTSKE